MAGIHTRAHRAGLYACIVASLAVCCLVARTSALQAHTRAVSPVKTRLLTQLNNQHSYDDSDTFAASLLELHAGVHCSTTNSIFDSSPTSGGGSGALFNVIANNDDGVDGGDTNGVSMDDNTDTVLLQTDLQTSASLGLALDVSICPGAKPDAKTCCSSGDGCAASCPHANANCCANSQFCCPEGTQCVTKAGGRVHCRVHAKQHKKSKKGSWGGSKNSASNAFGDLLMGSKRDDSDSESGSRFGGQGDDDNGLPKGKALTESIQWLQDRLRAPEKSGPDPTMSRSMSSELPHTNSLQDPLSGIIPGIAGGERHHPMPRSVNIVNRIVIDTLPTSDSPLPPKRAKGAKKAKQVKPPKIPASTSSAAPPPPPAEPVQPQSGGEQVPSQVSTNVDADTKTEASVQGGTLRSVPKVN